MSMTAGLRELGCKSSAGLTRDETSLFIFVIDLLKETLHDIGVFVLLTDRL